MAFLWLTQVGVGGDPLSREDQGYTRSFSNFRVPKIPLNKEFIHGTVHPQIGVSKNRGTPKWMVYNGKLKTLSKWMIWGVPLFSETSKYFRDLVEK